MVQERSAQEGLGYLTKTVTFDMQTLNALRGEKGPDEAKVFNLVRGLQREAVNDQEMGSVLRPLKDRAEHILKDMEDRTTTGLAAMDLLATLAKEKEAAEKSKKDSGLTPLAFAVYWALKDAPNISAAGVDAMDLAREAGLLLMRFPNAATSADEERRLRAALYRPLLGLPAEERSRAVERALTILLGADADVDR
jgi:type I restriction enzyme R subunit